MRVPDFKEDGTWVRSKIISGTRVWTTSAADWGDMQTRCREFGKNGRPNPTYTGAVCEFGSFHDFVEWGIKQVGYGEGFELDKDLIGRGGVYSPDDCVYLPKHINGFISPVKRKAGLPKGVSFQPNTTTKVYRARCSDMGKSVNLGCFESPLEAFLAYKSYKESVARKLAELWKDKIDIRAYNALIRYELKED